jgi:hypothetical protein
VNQVSIDIAETELDFFLKRVNRVFTVLFIGCSPPLMERDRS